jgi:uncharacterized cofD-like protein
VAIGGGTGLSALLQGLKRYARGDEAVQPRLDITAVVTVSDDGGSSGRLRREFSVLPPGDIRNCLVALSQDEALMSRLFQYRFESGRGLKGHSFGNLILTALTHVMGDFPDAVKASAEVLNISGRIYPCTAASVTLEAVLEDGTHVLGETRISKSRRMIRQIRLSPRNVRPLADTLAAIAGADLITFGPGSLFTSVVPNLLVAGIPAAIRSSPALKAYFVNLMWQPGETMNFSAFDHIQVIHRHARRKLLDCAVVNTAPIARALKRRYARQSVEPVQLDVDKILAAGMQVVAGNLLQQNVKVRHDPEQIAAVAVGLAREGRRRRLKAAAQAQ